MFNRNYSGMRKLIALFVFCCSLSLHLWADEKENRNKMLPDMTICVNANDSLAYDGFLNSTDEEISHSFDLYG